MKIEMLEPEKYYPIRDFLKILGDLGLPHSVIWFENKLKTGEIPRDFIIQRSKNANRYISGGNIPLLLNQLFKI